MKLDTFPETVFLTGATGVLGGRILKELLQSTSSRIYCLARGQSPAHSQERVRSFLRVYDEKDTLESEFLSRVIVLGGDVTRERLGLSEEIFARLQSETDITIHAAANTSLTGTPCARAAAAHASYSGAALRTISPSSASFTGMVP